MELRQLPDGSKLEEIFSDFKDGPAPFRRLIEAVREIHHHPRGAVITQLMELLSISARDLADKRWSVLVGVVDSYVKRHRRLDIVKQFVKSKRKLHLFGMGWEWLAAENCNVVLHGSREWSKQDEVFDQSKILLHIDNTQGGANDRVFWATAKGAALLAQRNPTVDVALVDGVGYLGYDQTGADILEVIDRTDDELEAIAASGSLKSRAHHTWDDRIRDAVQYMRTLNARDVAVVASRAPEVKPEDKELVVQIFQLDSRNDHVGVFAYLSNGPYEETDALFALYKLMTTGRFQSAFLVAKVMAGKEQKNPTIDLARAIGGVLFGNKEDEAHGTATLARWLSRMTAEQRRGFCAQVAVPTFEQATDAKVVGKDRELKERILKIRALVVPEAKVPHNTPPKPAPKRPAKPDPSTHSAAKPRPAKQ